METGKHTTKAPFLVLTALSEFRDASRPEVALGEWCRVYTSGAVSHSTNTAFSVVNPWTDRKSLCAAYDEVTMLSNRLIPLLGAALNSIHATNHGGRFWRILLGPWLTPYLSSLYERYSTIKAATEQFPDFETVVLDEDSFVTPRDTLDFVYLVCDDPYNLQLFTRILTFLGYTFPCRSLDASSFLRSETTNSLSTNTLSRCIKRYIKSIFNACGRQSVRSPAIYLKDSYFPNNSELRLTMQSRGTVWPNRSATLRLEPRPTDAAGRATIGSLLPGDTEFEQLCRVTIPADLPQCFVEGFATFAAQVRTCYPANPRAIFSANAWYYDELFKQWAAASAERGTLLLGTQHGGNYGSIAQMPSEDHETSITDYYFSWGWEREDCHAQVIPMPATKLFGSTPLGSTGDTGDDILYVGTSAPRYLIQFPYSPDDFAEYLHWQERFTAALSRDVRSQLRVRLHYADYGWSIAQRWREHAPECIHESWQTPFLQSLSQCRLYVCDHLSTTFIETLVANKPTILFWDAAANGLREAARPYYEQLREAGILYDTPEAAAHAVSQVYHDVPGWWYGEKPQKARTAFIKRFGRTSAKANDEWVHLFGRLLKGDVPAGAGRPQGC